MSGASSNEAAWFALLEPVRAEPPLAPRPDDPRLGEVIERWDGNPAALLPGRAVIVGFPQDEGVRRNRGRVGAARAPDAIRECLHRLTAADAREEISLAGCSPLDAGNVRMAGSLENTQQSLGRIVGGILRSRAVPVVLGGGHETAYGHFLGYVDTQLAVGIINIDAHLDVRPWPAGQGHSGSPFRQAIENAARPLPGSRYVCIGAQPFATSRDHIRFVTERGGKVYWSDALLETTFAQEKQRLAADGCRVLLTVDADAFSAADVPGVSAPNPAGYPGHAAAPLARTAGLAPDIASFELVEVNPALDIDGRTARWAAITVWSFLMGLARRGKPG
jgi:formiminoglutamase